MLLHVKSKAYSAVNRPLKSPNVAGTEENEEDRKKENQRWFWVTHHSPPSFVAAAATVRRLEEEERRRRRREEGGFSGEREEGVRYFKEVKGEGRVWLDEIRVVYDNL